LFFEKKIHIFKIVTSFAGSERALIVGTVDRDEGDDDDDALIDVCYFIVGGNDVNTTFDLHPLRHELVPIR
jgi:hypothetical protein